MVDTHAIRKLVKVISVIKTPSNFAHLSAVWLCFNPQKKEVTRALRVQGLRKRRSIYPADMSLCVWVFVRFGKGVLACFLRG